MSLSEAEARALVEPYFDALFYRSSHPGLVAAAEDPLDHFLAHGWHEDRNPNASFDMAHYRAAYPDVGAAGVNPFVHYVLAGRGEGRRPRRALDAVRRQLEASSSPQSRVDEWRGAADLASPMRAAAVGSALREADQAGGLVVSVSHDDYALHSGGVQSLVGDEQRAFAAARCGYLHLSPAAPLPMLAEPQASAGFRVRVRLDGRALGVAMLSDVTAAVAAVQAAGTRVELVVHHLMGWAPEAVTALAAAMRGRPTVWLHDFFSLCSSFALMRNDVVFCHAPTANSAACQVCTFGEGRPEHVARMAAFFAATRPFMLAPSRAALAFWQERATLAHAGAAVVPLARLLLSDEPEDAAPRPSRPLRVAHLGACMTHKGWTVFEALALLLAGDKRYEFYQLGNEPTVRLGCIRSVPVRVAAASRSAMIEAIAERSIDVVVSWSLWPETFCFTVHESIAAGAFVVARAGAGNVWPAVREHAMGRGCVLEDEAALQALFTSGELGRLVADAPSRRGALLPGSGTAEWLLRGRMRLTDAPAPALAGCPVLAGVDA